MHILSIDNYMHVIFEKNVAEKNPKSVKVYRVICSEVPKKGDQTLIVY